MAPTASIQSFRPPVEGSEQPSWVALSPDESQLAFTLRRARPAPEPPTTTGAVAPPSPADLAGHTYDLYVAPVGGGDRRRLVEGEDRLIERPRWSPTGEHLAWVNGSNLPHGGGDTIGLCRSDAPSEATRIPGRAFAWMPSGRTLIVANGADRVLLEMTPAGEIRRELGILPHDEDPHFPPSIAVSEDGERIAYSVRLVGDDVSQVWVVDGRNHRRADILTEIPGTAAHVFPFWSPGADDLGIYMVHLSEEMSAIVTVEGLEGDGEIAYESILLDAPTEPVWLSKRHVLLLRAPRAKNRHANTGPTALSVVALDGSAVTELAEPGALQGRLRRGATEGTAFVDGPGAAHRIVVEGI